jgi:hypothetical protein
MLRIWAIVLLLISNFLKQRGIDIGIDHIDEKKSAEIISNVTLYAGALSGAAGYIIREVNHIKSGRSKWYILVYKTLFCLKGNKL